MTKFLIIFIVAATSAALAFPSLDIEGLHVTPIRNIRSSDFGGDDDHHYRQNSDYENHGEDDLEDVHSGSVGDYGNGESSHGYNNYPNEESNSYSQSSAHAGSENTPYGSSSYAHAHSSSESDDYSK